MPEKFESILRSVVPLILIIAVSWFFSFLASKAKKQTGQPDSAQKPEGNKGLAEIFFEEEDNRQPGMPAQTQGPSAAPPPESGIHTWQSLSAGPQVTPKPIKPKWWGA